MFRVATRAFAQAGLRISAAPAVHLTRFDRRIGGAVLAAGSAAAFVGCRNDCAGDDEARPAKKTHHSKPWTGEDVRKALGLTTST